MLGWETNALAMHLKELHADDHVSRSPSAAPARGICLALQTIRARLDLMSSSHRLSAAAH